MRPVDSIRLIGLGLTANRYLALYFLDIIMETPQGRYRNHQQPARSLGFSSV